MTEVSKKELQEIYNFYKDCTEGIGTPKTWNEIGL
jgi:hypothetical protein